MNYLKNKSEINFLAANLLQQNGCYPSVVHCAYYSCFQLIKHLWLVTMRKTEQDLTVINQQHPKEGSHEVLINEIKRYIKGKSLNDRDWNNQMVQLKKLRTKADYENKEIDCTSANNSIALAQNIQIILKNCL